MKQEITRKRRRTTMAESPRPASHGFTSAMWRKTPVQISTKDEPSNFRPNSPFICVDATVRAAADTNLFFFSSEHTKPGRTLANSFSKHLQYDMSGIELSWFDWTCLVVSVFSLLKGRKFPECWNLCKSNWLNLVGQVISFPGDNFKSEVKISVAVELEQIWLERFRCHSAPLPFLLECSNSECYRPGDDGRRDEFDENAESEHCGQHLDAAGQEGQQNGVLGTARTRVRVPGNRKPMEIESTIEIGPTL